nr:hypothetical protein [Paraglaciecola sp. L3A3]
MGTVSALADKHCDHVKQVIAFEPNKQSFTLLSENLKSLPKEVICQYSAVSDFNGKALFTASNTRIVPTMKEV